MNNKEFYNQYWQERQLTTGTPYDRWKNRLADKFIREGGKLLDMGCGSGETATLFAGKVDVTGADISEVALEQVKGIKPVLFDHLPLELPDKHFDYIICFDVLEHIFDPAEWCREAQRLLKDDGVFLVNVPNGHNIINRLSFLLGNHIDVMDTAHKHGQLFSEHIRWFSPEILTKLLQQNGFEIAHSAHYFPSSFSEPGWRKLQLAGNIINRLNLPSLCPSLLALSLFVAARKK